MKKILVLGAGLSSASLIQYLLKNARKENWEITVADSNLDAAKIRIGRNKAGKAITLDILDEYKRSSIVKKSNLVISLLPPSLHHLVAFNCIEARIPMITASYVSEEMKKLHPLALKAGVLLLNEIGLDPGIDHMSAMEMIHNVQKKGGKITSFESYCGGLVAPEFDNNPWHYKFTWNPRNVVLAGQNTAKYLENGLLKLIPPSRIFGQTKTIKVKGHGSFDAYANRDSLSYIDPYGISTAQTVLRGTLRAKGFCESWQQLVSLGLTDDSYELIQPETLTYRDWLCSLIPNANLQNLEDEICSFSNLKKSSKAYKNMIWLGLFEPKPIGLQKATPAQALQKLLQEKWMLEKGELDQIVMKHEIGYQIKGNQYLMEASLVVTGENQVQTAMAKTVGLPMGIAAKLILQGNIKSSGVQIPINKEIYQPILKELAKIGIAFIHSEVKV
jgi:saccharopine dehydrogenase-like NADP-dependent oxidoreductase